MLQQHEYLDPSSIQKITFQVFKNLVVGNFQTGTDNFLLVILNSLVSRQKLFQGFNKNKKISFLLKDPFIIIFRKG